MQYLRTGNHEDRIKFGECKTAKSRRQIALSPSTVGILREHKEDQAKLRETIGIPLSDDELSAIMTAHRYCQIASFTHGQSWLGVVGCMVSVYMMLSIPTQALCSNKAYTLR